MAADDDEIDPLAAINAELREADVPGEDAGPWLPLESNPVSEWGGGGEVLVLGKRLFDIHVY